MSVESSANKPLTLKRPPTIDARAPRLNQAFIGGLALLACVTRTWPLLALPAFQLALSLLWGARACLACVIYFRVLQPRFGSGPIEDARPVRFANLVGFLFLGAACVAHAIGYATLGWILGWIVAGLAWLAAGTGVCVGCSAYRFWARLRGIGQRRVQRIDLSELGLSPMPRLVVQFTYPRCTDCQVSRIASGRKASRSRSSMSRDDPTWRASMASIWFLWPIRSPRTVRC